MQRCQHSAADWRFVGTAGCLRVDLAVAGTAAVADTVHFAAGSLEPVVGFEQVYFVVVGGTVVVGRSVLVCFVADGDIFRWYSILASWRACLYCLTEPGEN